MVPIRGRSKTRNFSPIKVEENKSYLYKPLLVGLYMYLNVFFTDEESKKRNSHNLRSMKLDILCKLIVLLLSLVLPSGCFEQR